MFSGPVPTRPGNRRTQRPAPHARLAGGKDLAHLGWLAHLGRLGRLRQARIRILLLRRRSLPAESIRLVVLVSVTSAEVLDTRALIVHLCHVLPPSSERRIVVIIVARRALGCHDNRRDHDWTRYQNPSVHHRLYDDA